MQQQESENNPEPAMPTPSAQKAAEPSEHKQRQNQPNVIQRFRIAIPLGIQAANVIFRAAKEDSTALQVEDTLVKSFGQFSISVQSLQMFKDQLAKMRLRIDHARLEDIYVMGGVLIYCGILFPMLLSLGIPDFPTRFAWIAFAISFPCTVGFFLVRFLKAKNNISSQGWLHSILAFLAEIGVIAVTASLFFHIWNVVGWVFLLCTLVIFLGYQRYRWNIYYTPFLSIFKAILKELSDTPPAPV